MAKKFMSINVNYLYTNEKNERKLHDIKIKDSKDIFTTSMYSFCADRGIDIVLIDNMDKNTCLNTTKSFDYKYYSNWGYVNYLGPIEPEDSYKTNIYYNDYDKCYIMGFSNSMVNRIDFDYSNKLKEKINSEMYPDWENTINDDIYTMKPYISNVYCSFDCDTRSGNEWDVDIYLELNDREEKVLLSPNGVVELDPTATNRLANGLPTIFKLSIVNKSNEILEIKNIALGIEVQYFKILQ